MALTEVFVRHAPSPIVESIEFGTIISSIFTYNIPIDR